MRLRGYLACLNIAALVLAGGCSRGAPSREPQRTTFDVRSSPTTPDPHRASGQQLALIIGPQCAEPGRMQYKGDKQGKAFYALDCGRAAFLVAVGADGKGDAVACVDADRRGTPCWQEW